MELNKKKYLKREVESIVAELSRGYETKLSEQKARIAELVRENAEFHAETDAYRAQDQKIADAVKRAEEYSRDQREKSDMQYALAAARISAFLNKWGKYFDHIKEKYPMYPVVQNAVRLTEKVSKIIGDSDAKTIICAAEDGLNAICGGDGTFNPEKKIADYIAATENNGFNMDEVLNPGALRLEDLCKELGLLAEDEL